MNIPEPVEAFPGGVAPVTPDPFQAWSQRLSDARAAADRAESGLASAVRDAARAGLSRTSIAAGVDLELDDVDEMLNEREVCDRGDAADQPPLQPVVFLRGRDVPNSTWKELKQRLWVRGLPTIANRTGAAHLARGGTPVIFCDFSSRTADTLRVGGVRGVYRDENLTLELINGGATTTPRREDQSIDVDQVVLLIHQVIGDLPAINQRRMIAATRPPAPH